MGNNIFTSFRGRVILHSFLSAVLTLATEFFLLANIRFIRSSLSPKLSGTAGVVGESALSRIGNNIEGITGQDELLLFVLIFIGFAVFTLSFILLQQKQIRAMKNLAHQIHEISEGNLRAIPPLKEEDEFSELSYELHRMAAALSDLVERERKAEQTKNDLITNIAHDLRTPLTSVLGYLDLLSKNRSLPPETEEKYLNIARDKAKHLQTLIEELFGFTKLGHGSLVLRPAKIDLVRLLEQVLEEFYPQLQSKDMTLTTDFDASSYLMMGDGTLIARLFDNLINNAIHYGALGKRLELTLRSAEDAVTVSVKNYGEVIPPDQLQHLFDKFYRVEASRALSTGGSGLGLAIVKSIVELHKGSIDVRSDLDGTVFCVRLPKEADFTEKEDGLLEKVTS